MSDDEGGSAVPITPSHPSQHSFEQPNSYQPMTMMPQTTTTIIDGDGQTTDIITAAGMISDAASDYSLDSHGKKHKKHKDKDGKKVKAGMFVDAERGMVGGKHDKGFIGGEGHKKAKKGKSKCNCGGGGCNDDWMYCLNTCCSNCMVGCAAVCEIVCCLWLCE